MKKKPKQKTKNKQTKKTVGPCTFCCSVKTHIYIVYRLGYMQTRNNYQLTIKQASPQCMMYCNLLVSQTHP